MTPTVDFIMPVYNEAANIREAVEQIYLRVAHPKRVLVVYDFDEDTTLPVLRELMPSFPGLRAVRNTLGRGVVNAIRAGIAEASADVVVVTMADLSDDRKVVDRMVTLIRDEGYDVVCASRYMRGGRQVGGPLLKRTLSRLAGLSLYWLAGLPTHDATNSFRAYRLRFLRETPIESRAGFAYTLELTLKAHAAGGRVAEVPATWRDRSAGRSRFELGKWLPHYLRWYAFALRQRWHV
jgi:dolichol-phosphate mannosyltransferase